MRTRIVTVLISVTAVALIAGCPAATTTSEKNAFLAFTDEFGFTGQATDEGSGASGVDVEQEFREPLRLVFQNAHPGGELSTSLLAWVEIGSVRTADQQDALLRSGYVQLTQEAEIGEAYTLPLGTFVYGGSGTAGATPIRLPAATGGEDADDGDSGNAGGGSQEIVPATTELTLITPDKILVYLQPPVSCDSVAFTFTDPLTGEVLGTETTTGSGSATGGGYKTLAQIDAYECDPFEPGLTFSATGGETGPAIFREGNSVTYTFFPTAQTGGIFATVTVATD
jgi:hypothetical protein